MAKKEISDNIKRILESTKESIEGTSSEKKKKQKG